MTWRVLDFSNFSGRLSYVRGHVKVIEDEGEPTTVNLHEVAVILCGVQVSISSGLLLKLAENGISFVIVDWKSQPVGSLTGWSSHTRVGARQLAQARLSVPRSKSAWAALVKAKILGQSRVQTALNHPQVARKLIGLAKQVRSGDPANVEGHAAQLHWKNFAQDLAFSRNHKSSDPLNSCLNYGYTVLRGYCIRSVVESGLWPALGVFHHGRSNAFNLVDDFIEPFRPVVDYLVTTLGEDATLADPEVKRLLVSSAQTVFLEDGTTVSTAMTRQAQLFGRYIEGEVATFKPDNWIGL